MENAAQLQIELYKQRMAQHVSSYEEAVTGLQAQLLIANNQIEELQAKVEELSPDEADE